MSTKKQYDSIADVQKAFPDTVLIYYCSWGGQVLDKWMWTAELNGEIQDYHKKDSLKKQAEAAGKKWVVLKISKPFKAIIVERSK